MATVKGDCGAVQVGCGPWIPVTSWTVTISDGEKVVETYTAEAPAVFFPVVLCRPYVHRPKRLVDWLFPGRN